MQRSCVLVMLKREGWQVGKKRVYRLYCLEGLQLRMEVRRRKRIALLRGKPPKPTGANQHWSMDFVHDRMLDGRAFRILTVIDQWSRESVCLEALPAVRTVRCTGPGPRWRTAWLAQGDHRGQTVRSSLPRPSTSGHIAVGSSWTTHAPGKPIDNGLTESFHGRLRDAREKLKVWSDDYNHHSPHGSLGHLTPSEFVMKRSVQPQDAANLQF